jgi:Tol biopolymer transport system component
MTWVRAEFPRPGESALMVANADGSGERAVATRRRPELFAPIFFTRPSWSPDGKLIAASVRRNENPVGAVVVAVDPENGRETVVSDATWIALSAVEWLPDGSGILAIASREGSPADFINLAGTQLWLIPYPKGEPRRITNDASIYREPSVSLDGTKLVAVAADQSKVHLSRVRLDSTSPPQRISTGRYDGVSGVTQLRDGRLVFTSAERGISSLWIMQGDGSQRRLLSRDTIESRHPVSFSGGLAYISLFPTEAAVCVIDEDGGNRRVIARGADVAPIAVSPNGQSIVFGRDRRLWMISRHGTELRQLTGEIASNPSFSPDGERIAFVTGDTQQPEGSRVIVMNVSDRAIVLSAPIARQPGSVRWMPDGRSIVVYNFDTRTMWMYPLGGKPKALTQFDDFVWSFDVSNDGKSLVVAEGALSRDAVLVTGFR